MAGLLDSLSSVSLQTALLLLPVLSLSYIACIIVYRLYFHPLARFPGPKYTAITKWYEFYFDLIKSPGGQFFKELSRMHDEYGPIVRLNPDEIHIRDPAWFDVLYAPNPTKRHKYPVAADMAGLTFGTHGTIDHDLHRRRRMAISPMFSKRAVASAQDIIAGQVKELVRVFETQAGKEQPLELRATFLAYTTDVIYKYMFDMDTGFQQDPVATEKWNNATMALAHVTPFLKQFPYLIGNLLKLPDSVLHWLLARTLPDVVGLISIHKLVRRIVADYVATSAKVPDEEKKGESRDRIKPKTLFHAIDDSNLSPPEKSALRMEQDGVTVLIAGAETGSRLLSHTIYHLLENPEIIPKIQSELKEAIGDSKQFPGVKVLENLPWLTAIVRESLRLRAATTSRLPLVAPTELIYEDWVVPAGTPISMSHPDILLNDAIFPGASKFQPERWFNATEQQNRMFVPFGKGTRMCIGMEFAYSEMYVALAAILTRFELQLYETTWERDVAAVRDCFLGEAEKWSKGIRVRVLKDNGGLVG